MATTRYYAAGHRMLGEGSGTSYRSYLGDALGSNIATAKTGLVENTYRYKPYGSQLTKAGSAADPVFRYCGAYSNRATTRTFAESYVAFRHRSTTSAGWTTLEPRWPGVREFPRSPYQYAFCVPSTLIDRDGRMAAVAVLVLIDTGPIGWGLLAVGAIGLLTYELCNMPRSAPPLPSPAPSPSPEPSPEPSEPWQPLPDPLPNWPWHGPCAPCPPLPPVRYDMPPSKPHYFKKYGACCFGGHTHVPSWNQNPKTCECFLRWDDGECLGVLIPGPCPR